MRKANQNRTGLLSQRKMRKKKYKKTSRDLYKNKCEQNKIHDKDEWESMIQEENYK